MKWGNKTKLVSDIQRSSINKKPPYSNISIRLLIEMSSVKSNANEYFLFSSQNKLKTKRQYYETVLL